MPLRGLSLSFASTAILLMVAFVVSRSFERSSPRGRAPVGRPGVTTCATLSNGAAHES